MKEIQHEHPAWRKKADFVIGAKVQDKTWSQKYAYEQLAAKELSGSAYEVCCIPFALYDINLGDIVEVDDTLNFKRRINDGGHIGFRVATEGALDQEEVMAKVRPTIKGVEAEVFSDQLLALDVSDPKDAAALASLLEELVANGQIIDYENIRSMPS